MFPIKGIVSLHEIVFRTPVKQPREVQTIRLAHPDPVASMNQGA